MAHQNALGSATKGLRHTMVQFMDAICSVTQSARAFSTFNEEILSTRIGLQSQTIINGESSRASWIQER
jgi:hypothetical protein